MVMAGVLRQGTLVIRTVQKESSPEPTALSAQYVVPRGRTRLRICVHAIYWVVGGGEGSNSRTTARTLQKPGQVRHQAVYHGGRPGREASA